MKRLGIIGGGAMGSAIIHGILTNNIITPEELFLLELDREKRNLLQQQYGLNLVESLQQLTQSCDTIILAIKPQVVPLLAAELKQYTSEAHLIISIVAGITLDYFENEIPLPRFIRVMPNTPAKIGKAVSVYCTGSKATGKDCQTTELIFGAIGTVLRLNESQMDAATAVSGSGPAYVFYLIEAMVDAGVMLGLTRNDSFNLVVGTFIGAAEMLRESGEHPAKLSNDVTSPGGTTAAALYELQQNAVAGSIMKALKAAAERSQALGRRN
ncbi:MAG TPA: pyrroline-5-carboxylate reductase [Bacillota bacterium]|nr:pyrroline-5-carboxylate reductase [Bacillota bacterium]